MNAYKQSVRVHFATGEVILKPGLDEHGREIADSTPMAPPVGYKKQPSMIENIRALVRSETLRQAAVAAGADTFEEADDLDVGDDFDPQSPYEEIFDPNIGVGTYDPAFPQAASDALARARAQPPVPPSDGPPAAAPASVATPGPAAAPPAPPVKD